jgi:glycosyltransferase involved in cell wall biosynthesis
MKICLVSDNLVGYHKKWSGAEMVCEVLADAFLKDQHQVSFITTTVDNDIRTKKVFQIPIIVARGSLFKKILVPFYIILGILYALSFLRKTRPDIVDLLHSNYLFMPVMFACWILNIPTVFTFLDYYMICPRATFRKVNGDICEAVEGEACLKCISRIKYSERVLTGILRNRLDGVITFTETSKERLMKHGFSTDKIKIVYTYNIPQEFSGRKADNLEKDSVLVIASFHEHKGLHIAIEAFSKILREIPSARLKVIGQGTLQDTERINKLVEKLNIAPSIDFLGQKSNEEVLETILKNEVVIVPEQWPSEFGPLALVEAMALGRPVVGSKIGSIPDFIKDGKNGFLAELDSPDDFSKKIIWLFKNKTEALLMGERAREAGKILFSKNQGKDAVEFFEYLIEKR